MGVMLAEQFAWSDEHIETLKSMWADGHSASSIANALGGGVTRSAICGKVNRLGLSGRLPLTRPRAMTARPAQRLHHNVTRLQSIAENSDPVIKIAASVQQSDDSIPAEQRKTLLELTNRTCRWPCGDPGKPDFFFCGAPEADFIIGQPYCQRHADRAGTYTPARPRPPRDTRGPAYINHGL
jgi:GcrA cell cycle regulator